MVACGASSVAAVTCRLATPPELSGSPMAVPSPSPKTLQDLKDEIMLAADNVRKQNVKVEVLKSPRCDIRVSDPYIERSDHPFVSLAIFISCLKESPIKLLFGVLMNFANW